jgi:hypothetical protein
MTKKMPSAESGKRTRAAGRTDNDECLLEPPRKMTKKIPSADMNPNGAADDYPAAHEVHSNESSGQDEDKQVAGHASADNSSDGDPVKCPVCSATITTQEVGIPDTCDHKFCATCILELSKNDNTCPVDRQMFNSILLQRHPEGDISIIPVEPPRRQGECDCQTVLRDILGDLPYIVKDAVYFAWIWWVVGAYLPQ